MTSASLVGKISERWTRLLVLFTALALLGVLGYSIFRIVFVEGYDRENRAALSQCPSCNVVVIMIDTLRPDHLPFYGYPRATAPFLTQLARQSVVFDRAFSASSWTAPATASVFTARLPSRHGVITGFGITKGLQRRGTSIELNVIPEDVRTLGEFAKSAGYLTMGVADNLNIGDEIGFSRGFAKFKKMHYSGAPAVNAAVHRFISGVPANEPYFLYIHYMDPHAPYHRRQPWYGECLKTTDNRKLAKLVCAYDSEIRYLDGYIEELFNRYDWLSNSVVFMLSDHGEEFGDHGGRSHGSTLYREQIHVPFLVYHPSWAPRRVMRNVHTMDLMPTLAGLFGLPQRPRWEGRNLVPAILKHESADSRIIISERLRRRDSRYTWAKRSLIRLEQHLIRTDDKDSAESYELFDLRNDFNELSNLAHEDANQSDLQFLAASLKQHSPSTPQFGAGVEVELNNETLDHLKTLGYLD